MFNLIRRGVHGKLNERASKLLSELNLFQGYSQFNESNSA